MTTTPTPAPLRRYFVSVFENHVEVFEIGPDNKPLRAEPIRLPNRDLNVFQALVGRRSTLPDHVLRRSLSQHGQHIRTQEYCDKARALRDQGMSARRIAAHLGGSIATVNNALRHGPSLPPMKSE